MCHRLLSFSICSSFPSVLFVRCCCWTSVDITVRGHLPPTFSPILGDVGSPSSYEERRECTVMGHDETAIQTTTFENVGEEKKS